MHVDLLDQAPGSKNRRGVLEEELYAANAMNDAELAAMAQRLIEVVRYETAVAIGVHLKEVEAASLRLRNIAASIKLERSQFI